MKPVFDPDVLHQVVVSAVGAGLPLQETMRLVASQLAERYPGKIDQEWQWVFTVDAGGSQQVTLLYVSLTECLTLVGSPIPTSGFSGRYLTEIWDFIIDGELQNYPTGQLTPDRFRPGQVSHFTWDEGRMYAIADRLWMLEYSRGPIPTMFALPVVGTLFGTLDLRSLARLVSLSVTRILRPRARPAWSNWMGNQTCSPVAIHRPNDLSELVAVVREADAGRDHLAGVGADNLVRLR